jgi:competence protein ComEC
MNELFRNGRLYLVGTLLFGVIGIWYGVFSESPTGELFISMLDVGQGDAIFIDSPTHEQVLVDGGPGRSLLSSLPKVMPFYDHSIDLLLISNPDEDHIAGFLSLLNNYKVDAILIPGTLPDTLVYKNLLASLSDHGVSVIVARRGERVDIGGGAYIDVLFPDRDVSGLDTNTGSLVAKLIYGKTSMLLTGDAPVAIEEYVLHLDGDNLKSDILKVAHHGSKYSLSLPFYGVVAPQFAAVSVGAGNKYGHPNKETIDALNQFGIKILRTDEMGTIRFVSNGEVMAVEN